MKPLRCSRTRRTAFTLVELLVGMMLLASLAVVSLQGFKAHKQQLRTAEQRILAANELDLLMTTWSALPNGFPINSQGLIAPDRTWIWRTQLIEPRKIFGQDKLLVRAEILEDASVNGKSLATIDFLKAIE
jgi:prepilin-type N-terminal cleavage/methylation domain-containing protein